MTKVLTDARSIRIKGRSFLALVLSPELPLDWWLGRLDDLASRSAGFFLGRPVVLDVADLEIDRKQLKSLLEELGQRNVRVMGIEGGRPSLFEPGMPPAMKGGRPAPDFEVPEANPAESPKAGKGKAAAPVVTEEAQPVRATASIIVREPVRSGQSVIFPEGDVTVVGSVASGAEIVAGGSVHIYGTLRGAGAGRLGGKCLCTHLLPQARSGAAGDRRRLQDRRRHGAEPARAVGAALAGRRFDHGRET